MGHPVLRMVADPVDPQAITTPPFQRFLDDMLQTMHEYDGAGLAAPQVYTSLRVAVLVLDHDRGPEFLINPVIEPLTDDTIRTVEGCLSVEGLRGVVHRPAHIRLTAYGRDGQQKVYELSGFPAVVTQHECDHLDGVLFVDKAETTTLAFLPEYRRYGSLDQLALTDEQVDTIEEQMESRWPDQVVVIDNEEGE